MSGSLVAMAVPAAIMLAAAVAPASAPAVVHGGDSSFAGRGVVIVWGVLRGVDEASTSVVITIAATDPSIAALSVDAVDPFTGERRRLLAPVPIAGPTEIRRLRAGVADHPRTEIHFAGDLGALAAGRPALTVYFTGVPDTAPEFTSEAILAEYLAGALARARPR